ncbi:MAG: tRNA pseudouridine(55) synthase TruB [Syntrophales bacterium]|nr:tRNA pseudouridine(55) synthase TruB [Syntrophales bacterium]
MNGVVVVDKPEGKTSHDTVQLVRRILGVKKAGHMGTLDPLATGVLVVGLNEGTKLTPFLMDQEKVYRATVLLGVETDSWDIEGKVLERKNPHVSEEEILDVLMRFVGRVQQKPPAFSAVKFRGKALYRWARRGIRVEVPPRWVTIKEIKLDEVNLPYVTITVTCSSGTYLRTLSFDIGRALGCGGCLYNLRRLRSGNFIDSMAVPPDDRNALVENVVSLSDALYHLRSVKLGEEDVWVVRNGVELPFDKLCYCDISFIKAGDVLKFINYSNKLVAVVRYILPQGERQPLGGGYFKILRVFHDS